ncbi:MAG: hypothetical protein CMJ33_00770 [Phycisphaerae bacterium]|nr:hypothetical protein [Phycisphaerae bacterium]
MNLVLSITFGLLAFSTPPASVPVQDAVSESTGIEVIVQPVDVLRVDPKESDVDRRLREAISAANARYWRKRVRMDTLPVGHWTPRQAGWIDVSGHPLVRNWPWWAW